MTLDTLISGSRRIRLVQRATAFPALRVAEWVLIALLFWAATALCWALLRPYGPVGRWSTASHGAIVSDESILTRVDPFFRAGIGAATAAVTSLPLKLTGIRIDEAMGRGSAIIATPDGIQNSYAIGDEIVPGVQLKAVAFDNVTIDRGGTSEQLFIDQSVAAAVATPDALAVAGTPPAVAGSPSALLTSVALEPRVENGKIIGFVVQPKGTGDAFKAAGFEPGDLVTQINGRELHGLDDATAALSGGAKDTNATFVIKRGSRTITLTPRIPR